MKITFLGTGTSQGVPVIGCDCETCNSGDLRDQRLRSSIMIEIDNLRIVVDCGPDFRQQMLREQIRKVDAILITHGHKDHIGGLDDVRAFNYINKSPANVYAALEVRRIIKREFSYAFERDPYPGVPEIILHSFKNVPFQISDTKVIPIRAVHYNRSRFVFGFRIENFTYLTDAVEISEEEKKKMRGSKIIVLNALRKRLHYSHFNLHQAIALLQELKPEKGFITHISHQMGKYEEVSRELPPNISLAFDGLSVTF